MSDVVEFTEDGRTYRISGLTAKAESISGASQEMDTLISNRINAANAALEEWKGRHAGTFGEDANEVLSKMAGLKIALWHASNVLSAFPETPNSGIGGMRYVDSIYMSAVVQPPNPDGTAAATPSKLRTYSTTSWGQDGRFSTLAGMVNLDGVTAEVTFHRALTPAEEQQRRDEGWTEYEISEDSVAVTEPVSDVSTLVPLPSPQPDVPPLVAASQAVSEFSTAVAIAFENADQKLLDLLAEYPDLAGFIVAGLPDGRVSGESSLAILLAYFSDFDTDGDGLVSRSELEALRDRGDLPEYVQMAADYLVDNPVLFGLAETVNNRGDYLGEGGDGRISVGDIQTFLEMNNSLRALEQNFDAFDNAAHGGETDGRVSREDLAAIAAGTGPMADAARWLLDHDTQLERLQSYELAKQNRGELGYGGHGDYGPLDLSSPFITRNSVIGLTIDQQIYGDDPEAAHNFVLRLPVPERGEQGIPIWLVSDEGDRSLANTALFDTQGDLTDTHAVIAHLPETTGGVRNQLITGFYDLLAGRADTLLAGDVAGDPRAPGHPGANWAHWGTWASNGVRPAITGDVSIFGIHPGMTDRQAAADGNQWIFNDLGGDFARFIEMYERNPHPSEAELESFFGGFDEGDGHVRSGFSAYVGAMEETDPARRQRLLFEGNSLMAMHEQAGIQPYLEEISTGPDSFTVQYIDVHINETRYDVDRDVADANLANNFVDDADLLSLDPAGKGPGDYSASGPGTTNFSVGGTSGPGVVDMAPLSGIESWDPGFPTSTRTWWEQGGEVVRVEPVGEHVGYFTEHPPADGSEGSAATSWTDTNERMYYILKLFEQHHTDPQLYRAGDQNLELDDVPWLDPATSLG